MESNRIPLPHSPIKVSVNRMSVNRTCQHHLLLDLLLMDSLLPRASCVTGESNRRSADGLLGEGRYYPSTACERDFRHALSPPLAHKPRARNELFRYERNTRECRQTAPSVNPTHHLFPNSLHRYPPRLLGLDGFNPLPRPCRTFTGHLKDGLRALQTTETRSDGTGFEPIIRESKSRVLPLHQPSTFIDIVHQSMCNVYTYSLISCLATLRIPSR